MRINTPFLVGFLCSLWIVIVLVQTVLHRDDWPHIATPEAIQLEGLVTDQHGQDGSTQTIRIRASRPELPGRIEVEAPAWPMAIPGDTVVAECKLRSVSDFQDGSFRYDRYLAKEGVFATCRTWTPLIVVDQRASIARHLWRLRNAIESHIEQTLPEPHASFLAGLLYGTRSGLPANVQEQFRRTGTMHIVAVSGYNVTLVSLVCMGVLTATILKRQHAFWVVVAGVVIYVLMAGADPAVTRAGIMGVLVLIAKQVGRPTRTVLLFLVAATLMTALNPRILLDDVGFHLSFAAAIGLVTLGPRIQKALLFVPEKAHIRSTLAETLAATIATLPLSLWHFGTASLVAPIANLFVVPLASVGMLLGGSSLILTALLPDIGILRAITMLPTWLTLEVILRLVELFSPLPVLDLNL